MKLKLKSGFTLIELLVVISIISLLSSVVLASLNSARSKGRDAKRLQDMRQLQIAFELYYSTNGVYPTCGGIDGCDSINTLTAPFGAVWSTLQAVPAYIATAPIDPINNSQYRYCYSRGYKKTSSTTFVAGTASDYVLMMDLENAGNIAAGPNFVACFNTTFNYLTGNQ